MKNAYARRKRRELRSEFIVAYGGKCQCCEETEEAFLSLEHKNRDGHIHRRVFGTSSQILADLRRRGWPKKDYEILCYNCNLARWRRGICPHKTRKERE